MNTCVKFHIFEFKETRGWIVDEKTVTLKKMFIAEYIDVWKKKNFPMKGLTKSNYWGLYYA